MHISIQSMYLDLYGGTICEGYFKNRKAWNNHKRETGFHFVHLKSGSK